MSACWSFHLCCVSAEPVVLCFFSFCFSPQSYRINRSCSRQVFYWVLSNNFWRICILAYWLPLLFLMCFSHIQSISAPLLLSFSTKTGCGGSAHAICFAICHRPLQLLCALPCWRTSIDSSCSVSAGGRKAVAICDLRRERAAVCWSFYSWFW